MLKSADPNEPGYHGTVSERLESVKHRTQRKSREQQAESRAACKLCVVACSMQVGVCVCAGVRALVCECVSRAVNMCVCLPCVHVAPAVARCAVFGNRILYVVYDGMNFVPGGLLSWLRAEPNGWCAVNVGYFYVSRCYFASSVFLFLDAGC